MAVEGHGLAGGAVVVVFVVVKDDFGGGDFAFFEGVGEGVGVFQGLAGGGAVGLEFKVFGDVLGEVGVVEGFLHEGCACDDPEVLTGVGEGHGGFVAAAVGVDAVAVVAQGGEGADGEELGADDGEEGVVVLKLGGLALEEVAVEAVFGEGELEGGRYVFGGRVVRVATAFDSREC